MPGSELPPAEASFPGMPTGIVYIPAEFVPHDRMKAFPVQGECLAGDDIHDGDVVLVDPDEPVTGGDIAVVRSRRGGVAQREPAPVPVRPP
jgi:SOS-response transcriptional repressor LexA